MSATRKPAPSEMGAAAHKQDCARRFASVFHAAHECTCGAESGAPLQPGATQPEHDGVSHETKVSGKPECYWADGSLKWGCPLDVGHLILQLQTLDPRMKVSSVHFININGTRTPRAFGLFMSRERWDELGFLNFKLPGPECLAIWANPPELQERLTTLLERMARLVVEEARHIAETNGSRPGEVIAFHGDAQTFTAGMSESMRRIYKALGILLTPEKLQQLREAVERP